MVFDNGVFDNGVFDNGVFDNGVFDNGMFGVLNSRMSLEDCTAALLWHTDFPGPMCSASKIVHQWPSRHLRKPQC